MSHVRRLIARAGATVSVTALALTGLTTMAHADLTPGPALGTLAITPASGLDTSSMSVATSGPCPDTATNLQVKVVGQGFPSSANQLVVSNSPISAYPVDAATGGYDVALSDTMADFAANQVPPVVLSGEYDFTLICRPAVLLHDLGDYTGAITFTDPNHYTGSQVTPATVAIAASPTSALVGAPVSLTATVTPASAAGSVQFLDGAAVLGAPVAIASGVAHLTTTSLPAGTHSVSARFTPAAPAGAPTSTSAAVLVTVTAPAPLLPVVTTPASLTLPVGTVMGCPAGAVWTRDGASVWTGTSYTAKAADLGHRLSCTGGPSATIVQGAALKALVRPSLSGSGKVGTKLVLKTGTWSPALVTKTVVWKRDGKTIAHQSGASYVVRKTDKGHHISAVVTAKRPGFANGVASTSGVAGRASAPASFAPRLIARAVSAGGFTVPVGTRIGCVAGTFTGATSVSTALLVDGATRPGDSLVPSGADFGKTVDCRSTATAAGGTTASDATVTLRAGGPLVAYVQPRVVGTAKVGKKLTAVAGKWNPLATKVTFVWLSNGKVIKGATKSTYVVKAADHKHKISVRVTATRTGWLSGLAISAPVGVA